VRCSRCSDGRHRPCNQPEGSPRDECPCPRCCLIFAGGLLGAAVSLCLPFPYPSAWTRLPWVRAEVAGSELQNEEWARALLTPLIHRWNTTRDDDEIYLPALIECMGFVIMAVGPRIFPIAHQIYARYVGPRSPFTCDVPAGTTLTPALLSSQLLLLSWCISCMRSVAVVLVRNTMPCAPPPPFAQVCLHSGGTSYARTRSFGHAWRARSPKGDHRGHAGRDCSPVLGVGSRRGGSVSQ
jgi:hypothetical protein